MEKTITKIKTLKNRRKLSLPSSSPKLSDDRAGGGGAAASGVGASSPAPNKTRRVSDAMYTPTIRPRNNSLSPYDDHAAMVSCSASPMKHKRKVGWSPALDRKISATVAVATPAAAPSIIMASENDASSDTDNNLHHEENGDSPYDPQLSSEKLSAMRKSLRSRSIGGGGGSATPPPSISSMVVPPPHHPPSQQLSPAATPHHSPGYSLMAGLKGVNSFVTATGTHISTSRRLSTPCTSSSSSASMLGESSHQRRRMTSTQRPLKATHRSKRSESASTVEEEALKLRAILAGRHPSLPVVVVNHSDYIHCTMTRHRSK